MNKNKATLVVGVMATMLVAIMMLLYLSGAKAVFFVLVGLLAALGMVYGIALVLSWLTDVEEENLAPVEVVNGEDSGVDPDFEETYKSIRRELGGDEA